MADAPIAPAWWPERLDPPPTGKESQDPRPAPVLGVKIVEGHARLVLGCPTGCGGIVDATGCAFVLLDGGVLQWRGVPCDTCGKTFTVEMERAPTLCP
jgi:hypothetical protein